MSVQQDRVWMIGWEYPPHNSGGLGVACKGLTESLAETNTQIFFTLPFELGQSTSHMQTIPCTVDQPSLQKATAPPFDAYVSTENYSEKSVDAALKNNFTSEYYLETQVSRYAQLVQQAAAQRAQQFDVVHGHDWMSFLGGIRVQRNLHKPFIAHIHSTEFDRIPSGNGSQFIKDVEAAGVQAADQVVAVSHYTKYVLMREYGVDGDKIEVVHNGVNPPEWPIEPGKFHFSPNRPVILFMGRLTGQKGPEYFLELAKRVLQKIPDALFVVAGHGDLYRSLLLTTAREHLSASVLFSGFVRDQERATLLNRADLFIMPSISEPFGLVALEAAQYHTPVVISKQAGVHEVLPSAIDIDFWDMDKMVETIVKLLSNKEEHRERVQRQLGDLSNLSWTKSAAKMKRIYQKLAAQI